MFSSPLRSSASFTAVATAPEQRLKLQGLAWGSSSQTPTPGQQQCRQRPGQHGTGSPSGPEHQAGRSETEQFQHALQCKVSPPLLNIFCPDGTDSISGGRSAFAGVSKGDRNDDLCICQIPGDQVSILENRPPLLIPAPASPAAVGSR